MKVDISNLYMEDTGIPGRVIISSKLIGQNMPLLKYCVYDTEFSISIDNTPQVLIPKSLDGKVPAEYTTKCLLNSLKKLNELSGDEIEELKSYDATSYSMSRIGLPYVVWVYTYKIESSPIVKITEPSTNSHIIVSHVGDPEIIEGKGLESFNDDIDNIENWIRQYRDDLLAYWT